MLFMVDQTMHESNSFTGIEPKIGSMFFMWQGLQGQPKSKQGNSYHPATASIFISCGITLLLPICNERTFSRQSLKSFTDARSGHFCYRKIYLDNR